MRSAVRPQVCLNANRILHDFKIPFLWLMEHSKFVFQGNNLCLDSLSRFFLWYVLFFLFSIRIWEVSCFEMLKCWLRAYERETSGDVQTHWLRLNIGISCLKKTLAYRATANRTSYCFNDWTLWFSTLWFQIHCIGKECSTQQWLNF